LTTSDFEAAVCAIVGETFPAARGAVGREMTADDVDGWDSLGHSILLTRLSTKLGIEIDEELASRVQNVGELIDALARVKFGHG
jgi:acyl carrier protein